MTQGYKLGKFWIIFHIGTPSAAGAVYHKKKLAKKAAKELAAKSGGRVYVMKRCGMVKRKKAAA